jgi:phage minor structural protein GP20
MKTEFLKERGLEQEQIDKIMAENGKAIAEEKAKATKAEGGRDNYKSQLDTTKESLGKFDGVDVEALKKQIADLQSDLKKKDDEYAGKEAEQAFNDTLSGEITAAGGKNAKAIMAMLDIESLKASKD